MIFLLTAHAQWGKSRKISVCMRTTCEWVSHRRWRIAGSHVYLCNHHSHRIWLLLNSVDISRGREKNNKISNHAHAILLLNWRIYYFEMNFFIISETSEKSILREMYFFSEYHLIYLTTRGMAPRRDAERENSSNLLLLHVLSSSRKSDLSDDSKLRTNLSTITLKCELFVGAEWQEFRFKRSGILFHLLEYITYIYAFLLDTWMKFGLKGCVVLKQIAGDA